MLSTSAESATRNRWWLLAAAVGAGYGLFLLVAALRLPVGAALTGLFWAQPAVKALMAVLLAVAAMGHPIARERRWLLGALLFSAAGDFLLAMPWWEPSFVGGLSADKLTIPVTVYMMVLAAMVCAALVARLPTPWTAVGAVCFAVSDAMIGISEFIRHDQALAVPIWWAYATAMVLITAGFFWARSSVRSATPAG